MAKDRADRYDTGKRDKNGKPIYNWRTRSRRSESNRRSDEENMTDDPSEDFGSEWGPTSVMAAGQGIDQARRTRAKRKAKKRAKRAKSEQKKEAAFNKAKSNSLLRKLVNAIFPF